MRRTGWKVWMLAGMMIAVMPFGLPAAEVILDVPTASSLAAGYREVGEWIPATEAGKASGMAEGIKGRALLPKDGVLTGSIEFRPSVAEAGDYFVDITWPANANASNVSVGIGTSTVRSIEFTPGGAPGSTADQWVRLGKVKLPAGGGVRIAISGTPESQAVDPSKPFLLAVTAVRLTT